MGQRTQVFVQKVEKDGQVENQFLHYQWGFGTVMYKELMAYIYRLEKSHGDLFLENKTLFDIPFSENSVDFDGMQEFYEDWLKEIKKDQIFTKDFIPEIQNKGDNNNGYLIVQTINQGDGKIDVSFAFVDGQETEHQETHNFLTWEEYAQKHGHDYASKEFRDYFKAFLAYYQLEDRAKENRKDENNDN